MESKLKVKQNIHKYLLELINSKIAESENAIVAAKDSRNSDTKSSAGDKFETGRAMMQIERDKAAQQLEEALKLKKVLDGLDASIISKAVRLGSVVKTTNYNFYLSISAGKFLIDMEEYIAVSPISPIGKLLLNLKEGDQFVFNKKAETVIYLS